MTDELPPEPRDPPQYAVGRSNVSLDAFLAALAGNELDGFDVTPAEIDGNEVFRMRAIAPPDASDDPAERHP